MAISRSRRCRLSGMSRAALSVTCRPTSIAPWQRGSGRLSVMQ
jgi:hypothetical protein